MNILIIPEDFRNDQYMLKPIFSRLFKENGKSSAKVQVCQDPLLGGVGEALKDERIEEIVDRYSGMIDIFILCVDRDGNQGRKNRLLSIEKKFGGTCTFFAENAWEELETWILAGLTLPEKWKWAEVRGDISVKENYFDVLAIQLGVSNGPGGGRKNLGEQAARRLELIRQKCPEDFNSLATRILSSASFSK